MTKAVIVAMHKYTPFGSELTVDYKPNICYNSDNEIHIINSGETNNCR